MRQKIHALKSVVMFMTLLLGTLCLEFSSFSLTASAAPDSCTPPGTTYGTDLMNVFIPQAGSYTLYTRVKAAPGANAIMMTVDGSTGTPSCFNVGGDASIPTDGTWDWVSDYDSGVGAVAVNLTQGSHTILLTGTQAGISVDRVVAILNNGSGVSTCIPSNTNDNTAGTNCAPIANTASSLPTVSIVTPGSSEIVKGSAYVISANASDSLGIAGVQFLLDGAALGSPVLTPTSGSTYEYTWNSTTQADKSPHTISAIATDTSGYTYQPPQGVSITVDNSVGSYSGPSTPTNFTLVSRTNTSVALSWSASSANGGPGVAGYQIYRNGNLIASPAGTTFTDTGLAANTPYSYYVKAFDKSTPILQSNATTTIATNTCKNGDANCDGFINILDLKAVANNWGTLSGGTWSKGDLSGDGAVGILDLKAVANNWGL